MNDNAPSEPAAIGGDATQPRFKRSRPTPRDTGFRSPHEVPIAVAKTLLLPSTVARLNFAAANGCWEWTASQSRGGYPSHQVHRSIYEKLVGPIPEGMVLDHAACLNRLCVNPHHIEPVDAQTNKARGSDAVTHCPRGHEYTPENTYRRPATGYKSCRECRRALARAWHRDKAAEALTERAQDAA